MSGDTRLWMYRKGEARLFGHPKDVPEGEDWLRFPQAGEAGGEPEPEPELSSPEQLNCEQLNGMSHRRLLRIAAGLGIPFDPARTKAELKQAIIEAMHGNGA